MSNRLAGNQSAYLRGHAADPVDWWPWGDEALADAKRRDVPLLISVGYAACHWCHVMHAESFSDPEVAAVMNEHFVPIKVDRQQSPDVDAAYMQATQAMTGSGGWPMTVFASPSGEPFFTGTYYPPRRQGQMPAFREVLDAIVGVWAERRADVDESAAVVVAQLAQAGEIEADGDRPDVGATLERLSTGFDPIHGGFGRSPKFPPTTVLDALLVRGDPATLDLAVTTLDAMARGGIHDQVGGGFHRYSVDAGWVVPHFEKMLYDNALLLGTYARAWRRVPDHDQAHRWLFERTTRRIVTWLIREMRLPGGAFAAGLDADSVDVRGESHEGIFYVWNPELLADALGEAEAAWAQRVFHVTTGGTFEYGLSTLQLRGSDVDDARLDQVLDRLAEVRSVRARPATDDIVVAAWNGWLIDSLVTAGMIFRERAWLDHAHSAAEYVWRVHWHEGRLSRTSRHGEPAASGGAAADDYGALALGFARLAGALGDATWLDRARLLLDTALDLFGADDGGFFDAEAGTVFRRPRDVADNATPSGTASLVAALRLVGLMAEVPEYGQRADQAVRTTWAVLTSAPRFAGWPLADLLVTEEAAQGLQPAQVVVVTADPVGDLASAAARMAPVGSAIVVGPAGTTGFGDLFEGRDGEDLAYVCRGQVCFEPASQVKDLKERLWRRRR